ncbi:MAG: permease [Gemmatimonadetes bacterium]|nr:permease [Gemmatimonadota bacterium]
MDTLALDLRIAFRRLVRSPGFTLVATITLALGIGANTAIFSVVDAALLRALPYPDAGRIVRIYGTAKSGLGTVSPPDFVDYRAQARSFVGMAAVNEGSYALSGDGAAEQVSGAGVTGDYFTVMGMAPQLGRAIGADDAVVGAAPVAVISDGLWRRRFGADSLLVGRTIILDAVATRVIGVMPARFDYPEQSTVWTPMSFTPQALATQRGAHYLNVVGRLKPGATVEAAHADMRAIQLRLAAAFPRTNSTNPANVVSLHTDMVGDTRPALLILLGAVALVLLVACANVANLLLARAIGRQREVALRTALGATRSRLARELLAESVILALLGGAGGLLLAAWGTRVFGALRPNDHLLAAATIDGRMLLATLVLSLAVGIIFGLVPAMQMAPERNLGPAVSAGGRSNSPSGKAQAAKRILAIGEVALSVVLLTSAALLVRSFTQLVSVEPGFSTADRITFGVSLPTAGYETPEKQARFTADLLDRLKTLPGVTDVGAVSGLPLSDYSYGLSIHSVDGRQLADVANGPSAQVRIVTPQFLRAMGIPVRSGRGISDEDRFGAPNVAVLNESAARMLFPEGNAERHSVLIGSTFGLGRGRAGGQVVGVVGDTHEAGLDAPVAPMIYLAQDQFPSSYFSVIVHGTAAPALVIPSARAALASVDPSVPLFAALTMEQIVASSVARPRFITTLLGIFAVLAAALAAIGLYGVIAYAVGERTREIGIRVALGARQADVLKLVLAGGLVLTATGLGLGLLGSLASSRLLAGFLFGVKPLDVTAFALTALIVVAASLLATWLPALRAARLDPVEALRAE